MSKIYWTMRNGEKIDIDKMSISHLRNCLKMVVRAQHEQSKQKKQTSAIERMRISQKDWDAHFGGIFSYVDQDDFYD